MRRKFSDHLQQANCNRFQFRGSWRVPTGDRAILAEEMNAARVVARCVTASGFKIGWYDKWISNYFILYLPALREFHVDSRWLPFACSFFDYCFRRAVNTSFLHQILPVQLLPIETNDFIFFSSLLFSGSLSVHRWPTHRGYRQAFSEAEPSIAVILPKIIVVA